MPPIRVFVALLCVSSRRFLMPYPPSPRAKRAKNRIRSRRGWRKIICGYCDKPFVFTSKYRHDREQHPGRDSFWIELEDLEQKPRVELVQPEQIPAAPHILTSLQFSLESSHKQPAITELEDVDQRPRVELVQPEQFRVAPQSITVLQCSVENSHSQPVKLPNSSREQSLQPIQFPDQPCGSSHHESPSIWEVNFKTAHGGGLYVPTATSRQQEQRPMVFEVFPIIPVSFVIL